MAQLNDSDFVQAEYLGSRGNHIVVGVTTFDSKIDGLSMQRYAGKWRIFYGHISGGKKLPVHKLDIQNMPGKWRVLNANPVVSEPVQKTPQPPKLIDTREKYKAITFTSHEKDEIDWNEHATNSFDLSSIPGVTPKIEEEMLKAGLVTKEAIVNHPDLTQVKGIGPAKAN